jgi:hypothetical protein
MAINKNHWIDVASNLERHRWGLMLSAEWDELAGILADGLIFVHSSGLVDGKDSYLTKLKNRIVLYEAAQSHVERVEALSDDAFVAYGNVSMKAIVNGEAKHLDSIFTVAWKRDDGIWRLVAHQTTARPSA